jgi:putative ABC transport system permease protein
MEYSTVTETGGTEESVIEERTFIVKGVLNSLGSNAFVPMDTIALISLSAANSFFKSGSEYSAILVITKSQDYNDIIEEKIREIYGKDIGVTTPKSIVETIQGFISGFSVFMLGIAIVSMIVAAVGVITTLLTSVMERTREIGLLKALGFKDSSIMALFLSEALLIGIIGATVGLLLGMGLGAALLGGPLGGAMMFGSITPVYLFGDLVFVWVFSIVISIIAGVYPAWRASRLDPVVALRKE